MKKKNGTVKLTPRELQVVKCLWQGKTNRDIASELHMSETTVKAHIRHMMLKLRARNRTQVVVLTLQQASAKR